MQIAAETTTLQSPLRSTLSGYSGCFLRFLFIQVEVIGRNGAIAGSFLQRMNRIVDAVVRRLPARPNIGLHQR